MIIIVVVTKYKYHLLRPYSFDRFQDYENTSILLRIVSVFWCSYYQNCCSSDGEVKQLLKIFIINIYIYE